MNAVEIEQAITDLAEQPFDAAMFPYAFLEAFDNKDTTIKKLKSGDSNNTDVEGAVLQRNNIHIAVCDKGDVTATLGKLKASPATTKQKAKFILATDGEELQAEDLTSGDTIACEYKDFPDRFGFFLPLAGISYTKEIKDIELDMKAARQLNRLYVELLKDNPAWGAEARRHDMNHFMARLIFCFFAEDTGIFREKDLFVSTIQKMSARDSSDTHEVIGEIFRAMNVEKEKRDAAHLPRWANAFPYVNGGLFSDSTEIPKFSKIARSYLLRVGSLDWKNINPDIFGSMIQAVADDAERGALGMHYTSVPNILKVLKPLFLDDLHQQLAAADTPIKLLNLRKRMSRIRVFDPACGSGNFLVIAYKEMRAIEAEINKRRNEAERPSDIPLTNFRGIELRDFPAEIARLALIIAEYQCNVLYRGAGAALDVFLPLKKENWITCGNALRLDWLTVCEPTGKGGSKIYGDDLFGAPLDQVKIDFENEGGETYICGNPPYVGATTRPPNGASKDLKEKLKQEDKNRKDDLKSIFDSKTSTWASLDYVSGWFMKAADYGRHTRAATAFVSTNSICQGQQVPTLWPLLFETGHQIVFAYTSFKWENLAANNAGVTVVIIGLSTQPERKRHLYMVDKEDNVTVKEVDYINAYLVDAQDVIVEKKSTPQRGLSSMDFGSKAVDKGNLSLGSDEVRSLLKEGIPERFIRPFFGAEEAIQGKIRFCIWIADDEVKIANDYPALSRRFKAVKEFRLESTKERTREGAKWPYRFDEKRQQGDETVIVVPGVSSESRYYLPVTPLPPRSIVSNAAFALYNAPLWNMALIASRLHLVWIATVCGQLETRYRYSNTLGWNTFPVPDLTEKNKTDLTRCAEDILLAREAHFPATIADLYEVKDGESKMPENLRHAHDRNDEVLERIYIGRRFKNDTERLEKLFELYTKMTEAQKKTSAKKKEAMK